MYSLIHLSGRQLLPNVLANLAFSRSRLLERSIILHSSNEHESAAPADRLFNLLGLGPADDSRIECLQIEVEETLQSVSEEVLGLGGNSIVGIQTCPRKCPKTWGQLSALTCVHARSSAL